MILSKTILDFLINSKFEFDSYGQDVSVLSFSSFSELEDARITWVKEWTEEKSNFLLSNLYKDVIVVCPKIGFNSELINSGIFFICSDEPKMVFFEIVDYFFSKKNQKTKISSTAKVDSKKIGINCTIGDYSIISKDTEIGDNVVIGNNVVTIGKVYIGDFCKIQSGAIIGETGFGYYKLPNGHYKQVPHLGGVVLGDYVEIGANTCIDRGTMGNTVIGSHSKIDNLVHIGHNVVVGEDCMVIAGVVLCGSCELKDNVYVAPGAIIRNQIIVEEGTVVGMQSLVTKNTEPRSTVMGVPARKKEK